MQRVQFIFALSIRSKSYFLFNNKNTSWFFLICTCCHFRCLHINIPNCYYALLYLQHLKTIKIFNFSNISKVNRFFLSLFIKIKIRINNFLEKFITKIQYSILEIQHDYERITISNMIFILISMVWFSFLN